MDKRSEPRVSSHIRLFVHVSECPDAAELIGRSIASEGVDFSIHGLQARLEDSIPAGSTVNITLGIAQPFAMFLLNGEIRWTREVEGMWHMGMLLHDVEGTDYGDWGDRFDALFS